MIDNSNPLNCRRGNTWEGHLILKKKETLGSNPKHQTHAATYVLPALQRILSDRQ